jgi:hypothetical protein
MRQGTCSDCGVSASVQSFYSFNGRNYCEPCVWKASGEAKQKGQPSEYVSLTDNSICARCGAYSGDSRDHYIVGKLPLCPNCAGQVTDWPYPSWLKITLAFLLILLIFALVHGRNYFHAGRAMYIGEHLVEQNRYAEALPYLRQTLQVAPESDKAALLTAKAALMIGDMGTASKALNGHNNGTFEKADDADFLEVKALWDRADAAMVKAEKAVKLEDGDHDEEAAQLMHEAANSYPESKELAFAAETVDGDLAFDHKDYDTFLSISQKHWKENPQAQTAAVLASALACKYAATGNDLYRTQSEQMLEQAQKMAQGYPESIKNLQEFAERNRYRLKTREIITKAKYDRRFRSGLQQTRTGG